MSAKMISRSIAVALVVAGAASVATPAVASPSALETRVGSVRAAEPDVQPNGDYVHVTEKGKTISGHGWWEKMTSMSSPFETKKVAVQLYKKTKNGYHPTGKAGSRVIAQGSGGKKATARISCSNGTYKSHVVVYDNDGNKSYNTKPRALNCSQK